MRTLGKLLLYSLFFPLCIWPLVALPLGAQRGNVPFSWMLQALDLPIVLFWYLPKSLGLDVYTFDFWTRNYAHPFVPGAFYAHLVSGCIAYFATSGLLVLVWRSIRQRRLSTADTHAERRVKYSFQRGQALLVETLHTITAAAFIPLGIWCLYSRPIPHQAYDAGMFVARLLDFPIAAFGLLLKPDQRGLDLFFGLDPTFSELGNLFPAHMVIGTSIYLLLIYLFRKIARRLWRLS